MSIKTSKHHRVPTSRGGTNNKDNKIRMNNTAHAWLHYLHYNDTPLEQLETTMIIGWVNQKIIDTIQEALWDYAWENQIKAYHSNCINDRKFMQAQERFRNQRLERIKQITEKTKRQFTSIF